MFIKRTVHTETQPVTKKFVRIIDENGLFIRDDFVENLTEYTVETPCPDGFILPKWNGTEWIEGGTPPEPMIEKPTLEERLQAAEDALLTLISLGGL